METETISNHDDIIDSRDVIARIEYLTDLGSDADDDEKAELVALVSFAKEGADYSPDWADGETLIRDSYFVEYAQELAEDIGAVDSGASWPNTCIDWEQAARELKMDYSAIEFDGVTYWVRN
jgi:antirestriction protein